MDNDQHNHTGNTNQDDPRTQTYGSLSDEPHTESQIHQDDWQGDPPGSNADDKPEMEDRK